MTTVLGRHWGSQTLIGKKSALPDRNFRAVKNGKRAGRKGANRVQSGPHAGAVLLSVFLIALVAAYLYQINAIVAKGYEIKEAESGIKDLQKENQKLQIREMELKSMYNIEKSIEALNLVSPSNVSYIELNGPVAMK